MPVSPARGRAPSRPRAVALAALLTTALTLAFPAAASAAPAASAVPVVGGAGGLPVEQRYQDVGPHATTLEHVRDPAGGGTFVLDYPSDLATGEYPVITWGNGTGARPELYRRLFDHLASWGFIVVASTSTLTGSGNEIVAGARYVVHRDQTDGDPFHGHVDTDHIAAVGHSQGATGALNANRLGHGLINTTVAVGLPTRATLDGVMPWPVNTHDLEGPVFFIAGGLDLFFCPPVGIINAYRHTDPPAAVATLRGSEHLLLPFNASGYLTAWLRYQLDGDRFAASAFVGSAPEIAHNPRWKDQEAKGLPEVGSSD